MNSSLRIYAGATLHGLVSSTDIDTKCRLLQSNGNLCKSILTFFEALPSLRENLSPQRIEKKTPRKVPWATSTHMTRADKC